MISSASIFKGILIVWIALCCFLSSAAQAIANSTSIKSTFKLNNASEKIQPLSIGDKVPDIVFENVLNYKTKKAKLSDFKGKLVILDMWSVFCTSCIASFPEMEKLQNQFKDKIQILLVNPHDSKYDSEEKIKSTLQKNKTRTGFYPSLPIPIHDSILNAYFPHKSVPHQIWIDPGGKLVAIPDPDYTTAKNIQAVLEKKNINIPIKNDWGFDKEIPLLVEDNGGNSADFYYRSLFTSNKAGIGFSRGLRINKKNEVTGIYILNRSLRQYISEAYAGIIDGFSNNRIILDVRNPEQFQVELNPVYFYCYDLTIPPMPVGLFDSKKYLQEDLKRAFNISIHKEKRKLNCFVLTAGDGIAASYSKFDKRDLDLATTSIKKYIHNYPVGKAIAFLDRFVTPLIVETAITNNIDIDFPDNFNLSDITAIIKVLKKSGFHIEEQERELEVVVITDK